jgi:hypothetical protein
VLLVASRLRSSEWLLIAYFTYVAIIAPWFFSPWKAWLLAAIVATVIWLLAGTQSYFLQGARDLLPAALTLVAYREMNWFARRHDQHLENAWIVWDRWLLDACGLRSTIESAGVLLPGFLELCYLLVYAVGPVSLALVVIYGGRDRVNRFWLAYLIGALGSYALFPYFPSGPPRTVFRGADLPNIVTVLRRWNLEIVGGYGIHSSVFPSAHVSCALGAAWGLLATLRKHRWIGWAMVAYSLSVAVATVYGRYHFAVDAVAGIGVSLVGLVVVRLHRDKP